jgi:hypothetical protein
MNENSSTQKNMKLLKLFLASVFAGVASVAIAQTADLWGSTRNIVISPSTELTGSTGILTNGPVDLHGYIGRALLDIYSCTNAGGALTATVQSSPDTTNWTTLTNYALISSTTQILYTNGYYAGTNLIGTNNYLLPGTITTATAGNSSNSFAGQTWLNYSTVPFTNSGSVTVTAKGVYQVGFNVAGLTGRYLQIYWTPTGTSSNDAVAAKLTGVRGTEVQ